MAIFSCVKITSYFHAWRNRFLSDTVFFFQLTFLDMIMYIIFKEAELPVHAIRWTRLFRPLFLVNISEGRQVKIVIASSRHSDNRWWCKVKKARKNREEPGRVAWEPSSPIFIFSSPFTLNCFLRYSVYSIILH